MNDRERDRMDGLCVTNFLQQVQLWAQVLSHEQKAPAALAAAESYARAVLVPVCGKAVQRPGTSGFDPDGFMGQEGTFRVFARDAVSGLVLSGWLPAQHAQPVTIGLTCADSSFLPGMQVQPGAAFRCAFELTLPANAEAECRIRLSSSFQPSSIDPASSDTRHLGCLIDAVEFL